MSISYPYRPVSRSVPVRRRVVVRRGARDEHWFARPSSILAAAALVILLICGGWLGWQVQRHSSVLSQEKMAQDGLAQTHLLLSGQRDRLLARDNIVHRAETLGLFPARPDQVRKIGGSSAAG